MKDKILNVIMVISILALIGAGYREYLIHNGKLTSDLNANGYSITNLPAGFFPAETDPTVPSWAKEAAPPSETDPTVPEWAKAPSAPLPPDYVAVSNAAMSAATPQQLAAKQDKLPYPTNAIPQGAVSGLATALAGKLDKTGGTITGDVEVLGRFVVITPEMGDCIEIRDIAGSPGIGVLNGLYEFPHKSGIETFAVLSDIPNISGKADKADVAAAATAATNYTDSAIGAAIAPANPTFSNAVLSVGLGIDTNTVAAINALVEAGDELPINGAATVGGLLLALAAAVAALKRTKADASALRYAFAATIQPTAGTAAPTGSLTDRAGNKVVCTAATGQTGNNAKLTLTLPPAVSGYVRDFLVKIDRTTSGCYSVDFVPYGNESVSYETADGSMPEVPDGAVTWLSFTESESGGVFAVRATPLVAVTGGV